MISDVLHTRRRAFLGTAGALALAGTLSARAAPASARPVFAVVPYLPARRLAELFAPLVPVFSAALGRDVAFASAPNYGEHLRRLRIGSYDIVADSLLLARIAQRELNHLPLARTAAPLEPLLVVPANDGIAPMFKLADLRGKAVAVTDRTAALAVIGLRYLRDSGIAPGRDLRVVVTGTHANSLHRLLAGDATAAIVSTTALKQVEPAIAARVRILEILPKGLSAVVYHAAPRLAAQAPALARAARLCRHAGRPVLHRRTWPPRPAAGGARRDGVARPAGGRALSPAGRGMSPPPARDGDGRMGWSWS